MQRPSTVPESAEWCADDNEWVLGARNDGGEYEGEVHYWRPDGTLCSIATLVGGKPDGECRRFHENGELSQIANYDNGLLHGVRTWLACDEDTTEKMHAPGMSLEIKKIEVLYERDRPVRFWFFLGDGTEVQRDGSPMPVRPEGVPEGALYNPNGDYWITGEWNGDGQKDGEMRLYRADGTLGSIETCKADRLDGLYATFYDDGSPRSRHRYAGGERAGRFEYFYRGGQLARRGEITGGDWTGPLEDYGRDGALIRSVRIEPPAPVDPVDIPEGSTAALIAIGWGGDEDRDAGRAREARAEVKRRAAADEALAAGLAAVGLDTAPRLFTADRLDRAREALADAVDGAVLDAALVAEGGVGTTAAFAAGGGRTLELLRDRTRDDRLVLQWLGLRELPVEVRHMPALVEIEASNNQLRDVPPEIADVAMLRRLKLNGNRVESLPAELTRLRDLSSLHLSANGMTSIPAPVLELEELETLNLGDNALTEIPEGFGDLARLDTLWLNGNALETLPGSFARLERLTFLHLGGVAWPEPPPCLWELESLETLWIASRSLQRLPADVARLPNLRELMVWYSSLESIPDELFEMTQLRELRIRDNPLPDGTIDRLREALPDCTIY